MEIHELSQGITAFISPSGGPSCGLIHTGDGYVVVDTTSEPAHIQACLDAVGVSPSDVCLVFITHSHTDHTGGISLFDCPVLAHKLIYQRVIKREKSKEIPNLPTEYFEDTYRRDIGGVEFEFIHTGGHTPGSSVAWLPESRMLFAGDLIYGGRYPILAPANIRKLVKVLRRLPKYDAKFIVPGHGHICDNEDLFKQLRYIENTWGRTEEHIAQGDTLEGTLADPDYPRYSDVGTNLHDGNIKAMYKQIISNSTV
jgi:cyclase